MNLRKGRLESQYTIVNGLSMHARVSSVKPEAPVIILVHGLVVSSRNMIPIGELLAPDFRVYAPDLPGYGESDKPQQTLELPELADILCQWMDAVLPRLIKARYPVPGALSLEELDKFIQQVGDRFPVHWLGKTSSSDVNGQVLTWAT